MSELDETDSEESEEIEPARVRAVEFIAITLVLAGALVLVGSVIIALDRAAGLSTRPDASTLRLRLLAQAASPFVPLLTLGAISIVVADRLRDRGTQIADGAVVTIATMVALGCGLLAGTGLVTDVTSTEHIEAVAGAVITRLATILLSALALWIASTVPQRVRTEPVPDDELEDDAGPAT